VIEVMCPIRAGGGVAIAGECGTGITVVMEEIVRRISKGDDPVTMFVLIPPPSDIWPPSLDENYSFAEALKEEGYSEGTMGCVQTFLVGGVEGPWTAEKLAALAPVDTVIHLAREMILRKNYPGVDVRTARSRLLDENRADTDHLDIARRAREAIAPAARRRAKSGTCAGSGSAGAGTKAAGIFLAAVLCGRAVHEAAGLACQPRRRPARLPRNSRWPARRPSRRGVLFHGKY
jgi:hypothetical protein